VPHEGTARQNVNQGNTMATSSSLSSVVHTEPVHQGVERVVNGIHAVNETLREASAGRRLPSYMVGITIMTAVTLTARAIDDSQMGFASELLALSAAALFAFVFLSASVRWLTRVLQTTVGRITEEASRWVLEDHLWRHAAQDPRVMNDILWAQRRDYDALVEEVRAPRHATQREVLAERRIPSPLFTKYY
jgi:hypothetical protein